MRHTCSGAAAASILLIERRRRRAKTADTVASLLPRRCFARHATCLREPLSPYAIAAFCLRTMPATRHLSVYIDTCHAAAGEQSLAMPA